MASIVSGDDEERWAVWMVQARAFAKRENFVDAVARAACVCDAVSQAVAEETEPSRRGRLQRYLVRVQEQKAGLQSELDAWRNAIAERRQQTIDGAEEEMARPLPVPADER